MFGPFAVTVRSRNIAARIAVNNTIDVDHRHYFENVLS